MVQGINPFEKRQPEISSFHLKLLSPGVQYDPMDRY